MNNFKECLIESELNPIPNSIYHQLFSNIKNIMTIPRDSQLQIKGRIDKIIYLEDGREIKFEEKGRREDYGDFLIEEISCVEKNTQGWISKSSEADFLLYYVHSTGKGYIYHFKELQDEWRKRGEFLKVMGKRVESQNETYTTLNWAIPFCLINSISFKV